MDSVHQIIYFATLISIVLSSSVSCDDLHCNSCGYDNNCQNKLDCQIDNFQTCLSCEYPWSIKNDACIHVPCNAKFCIHCDHTNKYCDTCDQYHQIGKDGCTLKIYIIELVIGLSIGFLFVFMYVYCYCCKNKRMQEGLMNPQNNENLRTSSSEADNIHNKTQIGDQMNFAEDKNIQSKNKNQQNNEKNYCPICLEDECKINTICGHYFHFDCLLLWIKKKNCCPLCKHPNINIIHTTRCQHCQNRLEYNLLNLGNQIVINQKLCKHCVNIAK